MPASKRSRSFPTRLEGRAAGAQLSPEGEQVGLSPGVSEEANPSGPRTTPEIATPYYALTLPRGQTIVISGLVKYDRPGAATLRSIAIGVLFSKSRDASLGNNRK